MSEIPTTSNQPLRRSTRAIKKRSYEFPSFSSSESETSSSSSTPSDLEDFIVPGSFSVAELLPVSQSNRLHQFSTKNQPLERKTEASSSSFSRQNGTATNRINRVFSNSDSDSDSEPIITGRTSKPHKTIPMARKRSHEVQTQEAETGNNGSLTKKQKQVKRKNRPVLNSRRTVNAVDDEEEGEGAVDFECQCRGYHLPPHTSEGECEREEKRVKHVEISNSLMITSQSTVKVILGDGYDKQIVLVDRELLMLHSGLCKGLLSKKQPEEVGSSKHDILDAEETAVKLKTELDLILPPNRIFTLTTGSLSCSSPSSSSSSSSSQSKTAQLPKEETTSSGDSNSKASPHSENTQIPILTLPTIHPHQFTSFLSWVLTGSSITLPSSSSNEMSTTISLPKLYLLGGTLQSPSFQNHIMDQLRTSCRTATPINHSSWMNPETVGELWSSTSDITGFRSDAKLLNFTAAYLAVHNPFAKPAGSPEKWKQWEELYASNSALALAVLKASGSRWVEEKPWDETCRGEFMVEDEGVDERWQKLLISEGRDEIDIERSARNGCVRGMVEWAFLKKLRVKDGDDSSEDDD